MQVVNDRLPHEHKQVYCPECRFVYLWVIPFGIPIEEFVCPWCGNDGAEEYEGQPGPTAH